MQCRYLDRSPAFLVQETTSRVPSPRLLALVGWHSRSLPDTPHRNAFRPTNSRGDLPALRHCFVRLAQQPEKRKSFFVISCPAKSAPLVFGAKHDIISAPASL